MADVRRERAPSDIVSDRLTARLIVIRDGGRTMRVYKRCRNKELTVGLAVFQPLEIR